MKSILPKIVIVILIIAIAILVVFLFLPENFLKKVNFNFLRAKPGSCLILTEVNCRKGEVIPNTFGGNGSVVGFKLPANTQIFSPEAGFLTKNVIVSYGGNSYNGDSLLLSGVNELDKKPLGVITFVHGDKNSGDPEISKEITKMEAISETTGGLINYSGKDYNLIVVFTKYDYSNEKLKFINDDQYIEKLFSKSINK